MDAVACRNLAVLLAEGLGGPTDSAGAAAALAQCGCDRDTLEACAEFASSQYHLGRHAATALFFERACTLGRANSCTDLGFQYGRGEGVEADGAKAVALYATACEGGCAVGCRNLGLRKLGAASGPADTSEALRLMGKGCDLGDAKSCIEMAARHRTGNGVPKDPALADAAQKKACEAGDAPSCESAGPEDSTRN